MKLARSPKGPPNASPQQHISASGWVTPGVLALLCIGLIGIAYQRGHGNLHRLHVIVNPDIPPPPVTLGPGGQDAIQITRTVTSIGKGIEFVSATFLPGRGMNVFQITALVPGHGEVPLLFSPQTSDAAGLLNGKDADANGGASLTVGGALTLPWAQSIYGTPGTAPDTLQTVWNEIPLTVPANPVGSRSSGGGLLLNRGADAVKSEVIPDGQSVEAIFHAGNFGRHWPSTVQVTVLAELTSHTLDLTVTALNTGKDATPFGIGWNPLFVVPSGSRGNALLTIPSQTIFDVNRRTGLPTGKTASVEGTSLDFSNSRGTKLGSAGLDETYTNLQMGLLSSEPLAELRDSMYNISLQVIPMSSNITSLHVVAPANKPWISIGPNTNADDPFGSEWAQPEDAGMIVLAPGARMEWKVRLVITSTSGSDTFQP
jgi:galactose mutarotase-like enzyme